MDVYPPPIVEQMEYQSQAGTTTSTTTGRFPMDEQEAVQGELELLHTELDDLQKRNRKKAFATQMPVSMALALRLNVIIQQLFPDPMDRLRFEIHYESELRTQLQEWEIRRAQADHPTRLQTPNGYRPHNG